MASAVSFFSGSWPGRVNWGPGADPASLAPAAAFTASQMRILRFHQMVGHADPSA
jgi:hypothetical protein